MRNDNIRPSQPYAVLDAHDFTQEIYLKQGISHFYSCYLESSSIIRLVPTGCIDLIFEYGDDSSLVAVYAQGTVLEYTEKEQNMSATHFGVRFMPGFHPSFLKYPMVDLVNKRITLTEKEIDPILIKKMGKAVNFFERVKEFLKIYTKLEEARVSTFGKRKILEVVKEQAYKSQGKVEVAALQEDTGYTARYINKVFIEEMGFSPKTFCKIIQFQHALEFLNYGSLAWSYGKMDDDLPTRMSDIASYLGYYDQPQFIRDFKKYAGITPKKYLELVSGDKYRGRIHGSDSYNRI